MAIEQTREQDQGRLAAAREALAEAERVAGVPGGANAEIRRPGPPRGESAAGTTSPGPGTSSPGPGTSSPGPAIEEHQRARQIVLRQLAVGPRTRRELADKLRDKDCPDEVSVTVLDRMTEVGLVDDQEFAEMFVRSRQESKGLAGSAIRHELRRKGVAEDIVEEALSELTPEHERPQAEALVEKRLRTMAGLPREVQLRRLAGFLARKGYPAGMSYEVISDAVDQQWDHRRD